MSNHLIDAIVVGVYLVFTFLFGIFACRLLKSGNKKEEDYFLAGRKLPGWLNGISFAVTCMNSNVGPTYCGLAVVVGLSICWYYMSIFSFSFLFAGFVFAVRWRQMGISTGPEFYTIRFGGKGARMIRTWSSFSSTMFIIVPYIGIGLLGIHIIISPIFHINKFATLLIVLPILLIYVWISGYAGVVVTDLIQAIILLLSSCLLIVIVLLRYGGPLGLAEAVIATHGVASGDILSLMPVPGHRAFGPLMAVVFMLVCSLGAGGGIALEGQRIFSCSTPRQASKVCLWTVAALFLMLLTMTLPTLGSLVDHPEMYNATPSQRETIYGIMLQDYLPVGLLGVALAALSASVMSTVDSHLNYGAQTIVNDIFRPIMGNISDTKALWLGRISMLFILVCATVIVFCSKSLFGMMIVIAGFFSPAALVGWGHWWWWRVNTWAWLVATFVGPVVFLTVGNVLKHIPWWQDHLAMGESMVQQLDMLKVLIAIAITTILWIVVALLTHPEDMVNLKDFYRRARPSGLWDPVRRALAEDGVVVSVPPYLILSGAIAALAGAFWLNLAVLSLSALFVGGYFKAAILGVSAIVTALVFKKIYNWHIDRMLFDEGTARALSIPT
jgi:Na+/proline symporter